MERSQPWDFGNAVANSNTAKAAQASAETALKEAWKELGRREEAYRVALAEKILEHHANGVAWTTCGDLGRGDKRVAQLRRDRDIQKGVVEAMQGALWRHTANRKDLLAFIGWSMRVDVAVHLHDEPEEEPAEVAPIGGRRAA